MWYPDAMRILPFVLGMLLLQVPAKADKFWLSDPENHKQSAEGSSPAVVVGVLIAESDEGYHVRIVGGEVILPKASVFKIEKDDLSVEAIVKAETDQAKQREAADKDRAMAQAAEKRSRDVKAAEASAKKADAAPIPAAQPAVPSAAEAAARAADAGFDPVLGVDRSPAAMNQNELQREVQLAWSLTKDRRYLKLLRQLRRYR